MSFSTELEQHRVADEILAAAYEGTPPSQRGWIKTTLALVESAFPARPSRRLVTVENAAAGFGLRHLSETVPWTVAFLGEGYASAIRLAAALMTARMAGVEPLFALCAGKPENVACAVLAALELTGVEQVFALPDPSSLLRELEGRGRLLAFGLPQAARMESVLPIWRDAPPRIVAKALPEEALIRWAHPDALFVREGADALYEGQETGTTPALTLGKGLEGCWLHPSLSPDFFLNDRLGLFTVDAREDPFE